MNEFRDAIGALSDDAFVNVWKPSLFDAGNLEQRLSLIELVRSRKAIWCCDTIDVQINEYIQCREPSRTFSPRELEQCVCEILDGVPLEDYGTWVYYPWLDRLVHILPEQEFFALRSDRNRYLILKQEQLKLRDATIGIVGLSVGNATALTLALEGVGGCFRLADFDTLNLSNLNRLQSGVHNIGVRKVILAARAMAEVNPYISLSIFPEGITEENGDRFLKESGKLDILVEECDDLFVKFWLRERARALNIPVVMETADRGLIDVERFDLEPNRPLFHGLTGPIDTRALKGISSKAKVPYAFKIAGGDTMSDRAVASLVEIEESTTSFPGLASGVALGGAVVTNVCRRMLLGEFKTSGRYYVDVDDIVSNDKNVELVNKQSIDVEVSAEALSRAIPVLAIVENAAPSISDIETIVEHGTMAPSGHNGQPWRFEYRGGILSCFIDMARSTSFLDCAHFGAYVSIGAVAENVILCANRLGFDAKIDAFPCGNDNLLVFNMSFGRSKQYQEPILFKQIARRSTNRRLGPRVRLVEDEVCSLQDSISSAKAILQLVLDDQSLANIGDFLGQVDRLTLLCSSLHSDMMRELRWSVSEVEKSRDGLDVATLELSQTDLAGLRLVSKWGAMRFLNRVGGGKVLEKMSRKAIASASAVGLLAIQGINPKSFFEGGREMQRLWLTATSKKIALQPITVFPYMFLRQRLLDGRGFTRDENLIIKELRERYLKFFEVPVDHAEVLLFRLAKLPDPTAFSLRRNVKDVLKVFDD